MGTTSPQGRAFISGHEGAPLTAYLDPVGIPTIYKGFTNRSKVATRTLGKIVPGKTKVSVDQGERIFTVMLDEEYEPPVEKGMPGAAQHEFDAGVSVVWNLGPGSMDWQWAKLWRSGSKKAAADYLRTHYNTAKGKVLRGLTRRRQEEALLLEKGVYTGVGMASTPPEGAPRPQTEARTPDPVVKEAQAILKKLGLYTGAVDGWMGPLTATAVKTYQQQHPHLTVDGIIGPATMSQLRREATVGKDIATDTIGAGGIGSILTGIAAAFAGVPWHLIAIGVVVILLGVAAFYVYKNRDLFVRKANGGTP